MDLESIFYGEIKKDNVVNTDSMIRFVDAIREEIIKSLMVKDMEDVPMALFIVGMCPECEELHLAGSKVQSGDGEEIIGALPSDIMEEYCAAVGTAVVNSGIIPVAIAIVLSAYFHAVLVSEDMEEMDTERIEKDKMLSSMIHDIGGEMISRFKDGDKPERTGEAALVQSLSIDGHAVAGFVNFERDSFGFARPSDHVEGIDDDMSGGSAEAMVSDNALRALLSLFNGARDAMAHAMTGKMKENHGNVSVYDIDSDEPML
jgi:hypothetical protein